MYRKVIRTATTLFLAMLIGACNNIEATQTIIPTIQKSIYMGIISCIIIVPIISIMLTILSGWKNLAFKVNLQRYLHVALVIMLVLSWVVELSFTKNSHIPLNSKLIVFSLLFQMLLVIGAYISLKKQQTKDKKQRYFL